MSLPSVFCYKHLLTKLQIFILQMLMKNTPCHFTSFHTWKWLILSQQVQSCCFYLSYNNVCCCAALPKANTRGRQLPLVSGEVSFILKSACLPLTKEPSLWYQTYSFLIISWSSSGWYCLITELNLHYCYIIPWQVKFSPPSFFNLSLIFVFVLYLINFFKIKPLCSFLSLPINFTQTLQSNLFCLLRIFLTRPLHLPALVRWG